MPMNITAMMIAGMRKNNVGHVDTLAEMVDRDLPPIITRHPGIEYVDYPPSSFESERDDRLKLLVIHHS
jgi:hypothetical protein